MSETTLTVTITGWKAEKIEEMLVEQLVNNFESQQKDGLIKGAREAAAARVMAVAEKLIDGQVLDIVENGWSEFNRYGEKTGEKFTVRAHIVKYLGTATDEHPGGRATPIERALKAAIGAVFSKEFEVEIANGRARLRAAIDTAVTAKIVETVKIAFGIK